MATKSDDSLSTLFRSLGPNDANFQATAAVAVQEAEQRWPLFQAVPPQKPESTPALSAQERQHWNDQEKPAVGARKPALSMPGFSDKLAQSLSHISGQAKAEANQPLARKTPMKRRAPEPSSVPAPQANTRVEEKSIVSAKPLTVPPVAPKERAVSGLFDSMVEKTPVAAVDVADPGTRDTSLTHIFDRLEGKEKAISKPAIKRSSFSSRLGKR